ncbi:MAG TPA: hypothetical protein VE153_26720, partial [Myxococcus sp.]|nr:hypothetical protein [Myxococcus sp.]
MAHPLVPSRLFQRALACGLLALAGCVPEVALPDDATACAGLRCSAGSCVSNAGQPMCRCGGWEANAHPNLDCELSGTLEPDDHGASPTDATVLTLPMAEQPGYIGSAARGGATDRDLFAFTAADRHIYAFSCKPGATDGVPFCRVRLLDKTGQLTPVIDGSGEDLMTRFATLAAGPWYLEVSNETKSGSYRYQLRDLGPDDHGDVLATATPMATPGPAPGTSFPVVHTTRYDWDLFTFRPEANHAYRLSCRVEAPGTPSSRTWEMKATTGAGGAVRGLLGNDNGAATLTFHPGLEPSVVVHLRGGG